MIVGVRVYVFLYVCVHITLFIAKIVVKGQRKLCKAQPRERGAFGATNIQNKFFTYCLNMTAFRLGKKTSFVPVLMIIYSMKQLCGRKKTWAQLS